MLVAVLAPAVVLVVDKSALECVFVAENVFEPVWVLEVTELG